MGGGGRPGGQRQQPRGVLARQGRSSSFCGGPSPPPTALEPQASLLAVAPPLWTACFCLALAVSGTLSPLSPVSLSLSPSVHSSLSPVSPSLSACVSVLFLSFLGPTYNQQVLLSPELEKLLEIVTLYPAPSPALRLAWTLVLTS